MDYIENLLGKEKVYKGEHSGEDNSFLEDSTIWSKLKDKIFDSSITVVLLSPNMNDFLRLESQQWIAQEISYSLKKFIEPVTMNIKEKVIRMVLYMWFFLIIMAHIVGLGLSVSLE